MATAKKSGKTPEKAGQKAGTFAKGHDPRRNVTKPGSGRPANEFKEWCKALLDDATNRGQVEEILSNKDHPAYATMFRTIADRAHGKPKEHVEHSADESFTTLIAQAFGR